MRAFVMLLATHLVACGGGEFQGGEANSTASTGGGGSGLADTGCADGTREGFDDELNIAACAGGFQIAGITGAETPSCNRQAGNDGAKPNGADCSVDDLCAEGWHVCADAGDVARSTSTGECEMGAGNTFWLTRQAQNENGECAGSGSNNLLGCGNDVGQDPPAGCEPLNTELRYTDCLTLDSWDCGTSDDANFEADVVVKTTPREGGVLCCRN